MSAREFTSDLNQLQAFRGTFVGDGLLESLERDRLIQPKIRFRWPDPIARRKWLEKQDTVSSLHGSIEPDGARWEAAKSLDQALGDHVFGIRRGALHPFDDPNPAFADFLQATEDQEFLPHIDRRVSVSSDKYPELYDSRNIRDFYTGWQVLTAAEVADMGIHIRMNMADSEIAEAVHISIRRGQLPNGHIHMSYAPARAMEGFSEHEAALDATVWSVEEGNAALTRILGNQGSGRVQLSKEQTRQYHVARIDAARSGLRHYHVGPAKVIAACQFLAQRWSHWNSEGRPLIADAYKIYLASAVRLLEMTTDMTFEHIRDVVGRQGSSSKPTLDFVWPNWTDVQKERIARTLQEAFVRKNPGALSDNEILAFVNFLEQEYQDGVLLRFESFAKHAFEETDAPMAGMASDLQAMATAVEHAVRAMGGSKNQLFKMFLELWDGTVVSRELKINRKLAEQVCPPTSLEADIARLRDSGPAGAVAADLIVASRLRGAVHYRLLEKDQFGLEELFVLLLRATAMTHAHVQRQGADVVKSGPWTPAGCPV